MSDSVAPVRCFVLSYGMHRATILHLFGTDDLDCDHVALAR